MSDPIQEEEAGTAGGPAEGEGVAVESSTLLDRSREDWPSWRAKFLNDFRSARNAKANDGLRAPTVPDPDWSKSAGADTEVLLDAMRLRHEQALARIEKAENRAGRLVQVSLSLLTLVFLAVGFQGARLRAEDAPLWAWVLCMGLSVAALVCLGLSLLQSVGVDRVGFVQPADPSLAAPLTDESAQRRLLALQEYKAAKVANWSARKKVNEFLQARAWLTRGVVAVAACGLSVVVVWTTTTGETATQSRTTTTSIESITSTARPTSTTTRVHHLEQR